MDDYLSQMMSQRQQHRKPRGGGLFDPDELQDAPSQAQHLQSEKDAGLYADAYKRHAMLPIGENPYTGRQEMAWPAYMSQPAERYGSMVNSFKGRVGEALRPAADEFDRVMGSIGRLTQPGMDRLGGYKRQASNLVDESYRLWLGKLGGFRPDGLDRMDRFPHAQVQSDDIDDQMKLRINQRLGQFAGDIQAQQPGITNQDLRQQMRALYQREFVYGPHSSP